jgi:hypothetical protein
MGSPVELHVFMKQGLIDFAVVDAWGANTNLHLSSNNQRWFVRVRVRVPLRCVRVLPCEVGSGWHRQLVAGATRVFEIEIEIEIGIGIGIESNRGTKLH